MLRHLILLAAAAASFGASALSGLGDPSPAIAQSAEPTITIACGGYDADGNVVNAEAAAIGELELAADAPIEIPPVCGGYTADGTWIGDD